MPFKTGHRERPGSRKPLPFSMSRHFFRAQVRTTPRPDEIILTDVIRSMGSPYVPYVVDQGQVGDCFACAYKIVIEINHALAGDPLPFRVSVLDLATLTHALERAETGGGGKLWDWGGDPADVATVVSRYGVRPARYRLGTDEASRNCDASPDTVGPDHEPVGDEAGGVEEDLADFEKDAEAIQAVPHEIDDGDPIEQALDTLSDRTAFTLAFRATEADMNATATDVLDGRDGPANHDVSVIGFKKTSTGYHFLMQNSWSINYAWNGCIWVNEAFMRSSTCRYAPAVAPKLAKAA